jgi:hypothetical protein
MRAVTCKGMQDIKDGKERHLPTRTNGRVMMQSGSRRTMYLEVMGKRCHTLLQWRRLGVGGGESRETHWLVLLISVKDRKNLSMEAGLLNGV